MTGQEREFRGVWFPAEVWLDERLTAIEKIVLLEIDSLDGEEGCYASNEYLAGFCQCSERKVTEAIAKLKELGYIESTSFDGRKRFLHSLVNGARQGSRNCESPSQNLRQRILIENTSREKETNKEKCEALVEEVVAYLNERTGKRFRAKSEATRKLIRARASEGFTLEDFKRVIDNKCASWKGDSKMDAYLRPDTLFRASKFEGYLNEGVAAGANAYSRAW